MAPDSKPESEFFDVRRRAHRVLRDRKGANRFNPFRHIPWDSKDPKDAEAGARRHLRSDKKSKLNQRRKFKFKWLDPREPPAEPFTLSNQFKRTVLTSWINIFLICVPIGLYLYSVGENSLATFVVNYIAEIPLWFMCDYALEEMEHYIGYTTADLLDIFTNNTVQVISSVLLLKADKLLLLQAFLIGCILSNILVLLGLSLLWGGVTNHEQRFNRTGAQGSSSLLSIAATSLLIPTAVKQLKQTTPENLVMQSRGVAVVLFLVYLTYTFCQMVTHRSEYRDSGKPGQHATNSLNQGNPSSNCHLSDNEGNSEGLVIQTNAQAAPKAIEPDSMTIELAPMAIELAVRKSEHTLPVSINSQKLLKPVRPVRGAAEQENTEIRGPHLCFGLAAFVFAVTVVLLYFCIEATVSSISALTAQTALSETFVGLILLPIPNCDFAPISLAVDDCLEQTMKYTVGRSIQTALLVEPLLVLLAWWIGIEGVTLAFDGFEVISLFTTILLLNFLVVDAKVHWVHGILLLADWVLIGIAAFFVSPEVPT